MLRLSLNPEPKWVDLARGVRVQVAPVTSLVLEAVNTAVFAAQDEDDAEPHIGWVPRCKALAARVIIAWEGVGDENGAAVEPSPEWIGAVMDDPACCAAFRDKVLFPAMLVDDEGNGSSGAPNGTSEAPDTVTAA